MNKAERDKKNEEMDQKIEETDQKKTGNHTTINIWKRIQNIWKSHNNSELEGIS